MQKIFNKNSITVFCASIAVLLIFAFAISKNQPLPNDDEIITAVLTGTIVEVKYEELMRNAALVVRGKITEQSEVFQITHVPGGGVSNFKDYYLQVNEVLRGDSNPDDIISIRIQGGYTNGLNLIAVEEPDFNVGDEVLAFLHQPNMGGAYNTEGDYYEIVGVNQGIFYLDENAKDSVSFYGVKGTNVESGVKGSKIKSGIEVKWDKVVSDLKESNKKNPVNKNLVYDQFLVNCGLNLKSGFITQEEYDMFLNDAKKYATIVK